MEEILKCYVKTTVIKQYVLYLPIYLGKCGVSITLLFIGVMLGLPVSHTLL